MITKYLIIWGSNTYHKTYVPYTEHLPITTSGYVTRESSTNMSFVDNVLVWSKDPMIVMDALKDVYTMKGIDVPEYYFGSDVEQLDEH